jgi:delta-aminolevulinic acid dehydratase/porphobilinogen synthase
MLKLGAENGLFEFNSALTESLIAIKRAGASAIISYAAKEFMQYYQD